jgi:aminocarboxymuconate-semialdehyde decarboxylase
MLFASDMPFDPEDGFGYVRRTLADIDALDLSEADKELLRWGNAARLLGLQS